MLDLLIRGGTVTYLLRDPSLNIVASSGANGELTRHSYGPFGNALDSKARPAFGFAGRPVDADSGLIYCRARWYSPELGRFITPDPRGIELAMKEVTPEMAELATGAETGSTIARSDATAAMFTSPTYKMLVAFRGAAAARVLARNRVRAMMLRQAERLHEQDWGTATGRAAEMNRGHETW